MCGTGKLIWYLPANPLMHANLLKQEEVCSLDAVRVIGKSGVPVSMSFQTMDHEMLPELQETLDQYCNIEIINAPYSHPIQPLLHPAQQKWEVSKRVADHSVSFYGEFVIPGCEYIHDAFLMVPAYSTTYSAGNEDAEMAAKILGAADGLNLEQTDAILYGGKLGITLKGSDEIINHREFGFFAFQRDPRKLEFFLDLVEAAVARGGITTIYIDLEAPYIGSLWNEQIWEMVFDGMRRRGLDKHCVHFRDVVDELRERAMESTRPHRILGVKWTKYEFQTKLIGRTGQFVPSNERQHRLLAMAAGSDVLAAMCAKADATKRRIILPVRDRAFREATVEIGYNQEIIDLGMWALEALERDLDFKDLIQKKLHDSTSFLVRTVFSWAAKHGL